MNELVTSAAAARALNVHPTTLRRWQHEGVVTPAGRTAGGHARWDVDELRRQVAAALQRRDAGLTSEAAAPVNEPLTRPSGGLTQNEIRQAAARALGVPLPARDDEEPPPARGSRSGRGAAPAATDTTGGVPPRTPRRKR